MSQRQVVRWIVCTATIVVSGYGNAQSPREYEFTFWPSKQAASDPRVTSIDGGPCGEVATAKVRRMPHYAKGEAIVPEQALEVLASGKVVRRWSIPVDSVPQALKGNTLIFAFGESTYSVNLQGLIEPSAGVAIELQPTPAMCKVPAEFKSSAFAGCWSVVDLLSHKRRVLAFEGVCT